MNDSAFRPATLGDYRSWLREWLRAGRKPTHHYDYPFDRWTWLVALRDFTTGGECGSAAVQIIVPMGVEHVGGSPGHNGLYFMDFSADPWVIPVFDEPAFTNLPGIAEFVRAEKAKDAAREATMEAHAAVASARAAHSDIGRFLNR